MIPKTFRRDFAVAVFGVAVFAVAEAILAITAGADVAGFRPRGGMQVHPRCGGDDTTFAEVRPRCNV